MRADMPRRMGRRGRAWRVDAKEFLHRYRKQCAIAAAFVALVAIVWVGAAQATSRRNYEESFVAADDTISVGIRVNVPGYGAIGEDGQIEGFDREYVDVLLSRLIDEPKIYEYVPLTSQDAGAAIKYGEADICLGQLSSGRIQTSGFLLSSPYCADHVVALVSPNSRLGSVADIESGLGVLSTSLSLEETERELEKQGITIPLTEYSDYESALTDLTHSRVNAVIMPYSVARRLEPSGYRIIAEPLFDISYRVMVSSSQQAVLDQINRIIADMEEDGTGPALRAKWNV